MSLVHHWALEDGSGTTADDAVGAADGTLAGGATWGTGVVGSGCIDLDGTDGKITFGRITALETGSNPKSVSLWVKYTGSSGNRVVFSYDNNGILGDAPSADWYVYWSGTNLRSGITVFSAEEIIDIVDLSDAGWHHIVFVYTYPLDHGILEVYFDGNLVDTIDPFTLGDMGSGDFEFCVGNGGNIDFFQGSIDQVKIFDHALDSTEVTTLYEEGDPPPPSNRRRRFFMGAAR